MLEEEILAVQFLFCPGPRWRQSAPEMRLVWANRLQVGLMAKLLRASTSVNGLRYVRRRLAENDPALCVLSGKLRPAG